MDGTEFEDKTDIFSDSNRGPRRKPGKLRKDDDIEGGTMLQPIRKNHGKKHLS
jgi:hypothetical protein